MARAAKKPGAGAISGRYREILALFTLAFGLLLLLAVVSYSPDDRSANSTGFGNGDVSNWIGPVGAYMADGIIQFIGNALYPLPFLFILIAWRFFRQEEARAHIFQVVGYFLFTISVSGLFSLTYKSGGILGKFVAYSVFESLLGELGAYIVLSAGFLGSLLLVTNFSFSASLENITLAYDNFKIHFDEWRAKWDERREVQLKEGKERAAKREKDRYQLEQAAVKVSTKKIAEEKADKERELPFPDPTKIKEPEIIVGDETYGALDEDVNPRTPPDDLPFGDDDITVIDKVSDTETEADSESSETDADSADIAQEETESQPIQSKPVEDYSDYKLPSTEFLTPPAARIEQDEEELRAIGRTLVETATQFNVKGAINNILLGPVVTTFEFKPDAGVKYSRVTGLADDLCLALEAESIRIDRIPGKAFVGIEVPNEKRETIQLREVIESKKFNESSSPLTMALGKTIDGLNYVADLAKMPHLLIAGATGAGKSVGVNTLVVSILYKAKPDEVKFIMVDPKRLELGVYADIPHLATPIITDPKRAAASLRWAVSEMERRYKELAGWGVRNLESYNAEVRRRNEAGVLDDNGDTHKPLHFIVIIIDELADLMMVAGKEVEESITRLAQMARAVGIHLVLATQRPSVDVITGLIKANFPSRISFKVSSKVDSRTIIDTNGAERLLGRGDMLFLPPGSSNIIRVHGAFVDEKEIHKIVKHIKEQGQPEYNEAITKTEEEQQLESGEMPGRRDAMFWDAVKSVVNANKASTSLLQRHLRIGYGRAAGILDAMAAEGFIGEMDSGTRARPVLEKARQELAEYEEMKANGG
jgi:DNA segregation ATPase FtsK/SpoIIIE, S-DNA-T family